MKKVGRNMKNNSFVDYVIKNKYIIICVAIVFILAFTGVIGKLMEMIFTLILIALAIYVGKKMQEDDTFIKNLFGSTKKSKVEYKVKEDKK